jgi:hypothetical protein
LTHYYGLRKIGVLVKAGAHKVMLMAAIAFNLKKYLKTGGGKSFSALWKAIINHLKQALPSLSSYKRNQYKFINR